MPGHRRFAMFALMTTLIGCRATIVVYRGEGVELASLTACVQMFRGMGHRVCLVDAADICDNTLAGYDALCFPDGDVCAYSEKLDLPDMRSITRFVRSGGGIIGIGGGASLLCREVFHHPGEPPSRTLMLLPGVAAMPSPEWAAFLEESRRASSNARPKRQAILSRIVIAEREHPAIRTRKNTYTVSCSSHSQVYFGIEGSNVHILAYHEERGYGVMAAREYGEGRILASFVNLEEKENGIREDLPSSKEPNDPGSGWELMRQATWWALGEEKKNAGKRALGFRLALIAYIAAVGASLAIKGTRCKRHHASNG